MSDGDHLDGVDCTDAVATLVNHVRPTKRNPLAEKHFATACLADETHILTVGFVGGAQPEPSRSLTHFVFGQMPDGKQRARQLRLIEHVHHVALVFCRIGAACHSPNTVGAPLYLRMVTGGHCVKAQ